MDRVLMYFFLIILMVFVGVGCYRKKEVGKRWKEVSLPLEHFSKFRWLIWVEREAMAVVMFGIGLALLFEKIGHVSISSWRQTMLGFILILWMIFEPYFGAKSSKAEKKQIIFNGDHVQN